MKILKCSLIRIGLLLSFLFLLHHILSIELEYATFEALYKSNPSFGWFFIVLLIVIALLPIIWLFFIKKESVNTIVAKITNSAIRVGTMIGNLMGHHGIIAIRAGFAWLGCGSIVSGGFGMIGGIIYLTVILSLCSNLLLDYVFGKIVAEYQYFSLEPENTKDFLPKNRLGSNSYVNAIDILEAIDKESFLNSSANQKIIKTAIETLEIDQGKFSVNTFLSYVNINFYLGNKLKNETLLSLLYFILNNDDEAKKYANLAIEDARKLNVRRTLPAFIYAASSLKDDSNFTLLTNDYFRYSILAEQSNPLIPLLFSAYLNKILSCFADNLLEVSVLKHIFEIMKEPSLKYFRVQNYSILLKKYIKQLELEQKTIFALTNSVDEAIKNAPKTLIIVTESLKKYSLLTQDAKLIMSEYLVLGFNDQIAEEQMKELQQKLALHVQDEKRLALLVNDLKTLQEKK